MTPNEQTEYPPEVVSAVSGAWSMPGCGCFGDSAVCLTHQSLNVLRTLDRWGFLSERARCE